MSVLNQAITRYQIRVMDVPLVKRKFVSAILSINALIIDLNRQSTGAIEVLEVRSRRGPKWIKIVFNIPSF